MLQQPFQNAKIISFSMNKIDENKRKEMRREGRSEMSNERKSEIHLKALHPLTEVQIPSLH